MVRTMIICLEPAVMNGEREGVFCHQLSVHSRWRWYASYYKLRIYVVRMFIYIIYMYFYILYKLELGVCWHFATFLLILSRWSPLSRRAHHVLLKRFRPWQRMGKQWTHFSKWFHVSSKCVCGVCMLDVLLFVELLYLWPSCRGIISWCRTAWFCECKIVSITT